MNSNVPVIISEERKADMAEAVIFGGTAEGRELAEYAEAEGIQIGRASCRERVYPLV